MGLAIHQYKIAESRYLAIGLRYLSIIQITSRSVLAMVIMFTSVIFLMLLN